MDSGVCGRLSRVVLISDWHHSCCGNAAVSVQYVNSLYLAATQSLAIQLRDQRDARTSPSGTSDEPHGRPSRRRNAGRVP